MQCESVVSMRRPTESLAALLLVGVVSLVQAQAPDPGVDAQPGPAAREQQGDPAPADSPPPQKNEAREPSRSVRIIDIDPDSQSRRDKSAVPQPGPVVLPQGTLTIDEAVQLALKDGHAMRLVGATTASKQQSLKAARRARGPKADLSLTALRAGGQPTTFFAVNSTSEPDAPSPKADLYGNYGLASLALSSPLYQDGALFFQKSPAERLAEADYKGTGALGTLQAAQVANQTAKAYLDALAAEEVLRLQYSARSRLDERLQYLHKRVQAGVAAAVDEMTAEAALSSKLADVNSAVRGYTLQRLQLQSLMAVPEGTVPALVPLATHLPMAPSLNDLNRNSLGAHPVVMQQEAKLRMAEAQVDVARGENLPKVSLEGLALDAGDLKYRDMATFASIGVKLSMPLFDSGKTRAEISARRFEVEESEQTLALMLDEVSLSAYGAYYAYQDAADRIEALAKAMALADYQEASSRTKFENRAIGQEDLLKNEAAALEAHINLIQGRYKAWAAYADWLLALGRPFIAQQAAATP